MANPIALSAPDGEVLAYACGVCRLVHASCTAGGRTSVDDSVRQAETCCVCRECGGKAPNYRMRCDACDAEMWKEHARRVEANRPEREAQARAIQDEYAKSLDVDIAHTLAARMSDISEDHYAAGWMHGLEYSLWKMVQGDSRNYGMGEVTEQEVAELRRLSDKCGGWIRWDDRLGAVFMPRAEWLVLFDPAQENTQ